MVQCLNARFVLTLLAVMCWVNVHANSISTTGRRGEDEDWDQTTTLAPVAASGEGYVFAGYGNAEEARDICKQFNGLPMPKTAQEQQNLQAAIDAALAAGSLSQMWPNNTVWIGAMWKPETSAAPARWEWDDGTRVGVHAAASMKLAAGGYSSSIEDGKRNENYLCRMIDGQWQDSLKIHKFGVICRKAALYDCSSGSGAWEDSLQQFASLLNWSPDKKAWCCQHEGKGCTTTSRVEIRVLDDRSSTEAVTTTESQTRTQTTTKLPTTTSEAKTKSTTQTSKTITATSTETATTSITTLAATTTTVTVPPTFTATVTTATVTTSSITTYTATTTGTQTTNTESALLAREEQEREEQIVGGVVGGAVGALGVGLLGGLLGAAASSSSTLSLTTVTTVSTLTSMPAFSIVSDGATSTLNPVGIEHGASHVSQDIGKAAFSGLHHYALPIAAGFAAIVAVGLCVVLKHLRKEGQQARNEAGMARSFSLDDDESSIGSPSRRPLAGHGFLEDEGMSPGGDGKAQQPTHGTARQVSASQANAIFDAMDRNHDGVITPDEFGQYFRSAQGAMPASSHVVPPLPVAGYTVPVPQPLIGSTRVMMAQTRMISMPGSTRTSMPGSTRTYVTRQVSQGIH